MILLDRDGVLNRVVIDPEQGTVDSPLYPDQVGVFPWVPDALAKLARAGYGLAIVTNQPAAAKGKTTRDNLLAVHKKVLESAQSDGARILSSHICFHRAEDLCACRKPKTWLLREAFQMNPDYDRPEIKNASWMVGDGVTDVQAGVAFGLKTAFFGPKKCDGCRIFEDRDLNPAFWGKNLGEFADFLVSEK